MWELKKELEARKENLIFLLKNKKDFMEIEKQHQIFGAIKELDHVVNLMEQKREEEFFSQDEETMVTEIMPEGEQITVAKQVSAKTRKFKIPIRFKFEK